MQADDSRPRILILSFSDIANDARVLKQVVLFREKYALTTCGYGDAPEGVRDHIRIPDEEILGSPYGRLLRLHLYARAYSGLRGVKWCRANLPTRAWDVVLANDVDSVPIALERLPRYGVHADLHEYSPRMKEEIPEWKKLMRPYYTWLCKRYVAKASSWTTVSEGLSREYRDVFGFTAEVVTNAAPFADLLPRPVGARIRLVHSGACLRRRNLMALIEGVTAALGEMTLDLYLTPNDPAYLAELVKRADEVEGVAVHPPVPYARLIPLLNQFDVGIHLLPPVNFNSVAALPNKLFDYVQARLGVIVGPTAEMAARVTENRLGIVTADFTVSSLADALMRLTPQGVASFKHNSHAAARAMSAEAQSGTWEAAMSRLTTT